MWEQIRAQHEPYRPIFPPIQSSFAANAPYTDHIQVTLNIPDDTAALLQAHGVEISSFVEKILVKEASALTGRQAQSAISAAVDRILERRENLSLGGVTVHQLISEGRVAHP